MAETKKTNSEPKLRRTGTGPTHQQLTDSDIPYPVEAHGEDFEFYSPQGQAASIPEGVDIAAYSVDQEFVIDESRLKFLQFGPPGQNLPKSARLYTVKGLHRDGRMVQLPFEAQIENTAGGDPADAIGLRRYQRKGITILIDWDTLTPIYCAARGCWAAAVERNKQGNLQPVLPESPGFCTIRHAVFTLPNKYKDSGEILNQMFGERATTSRTWSV
jgi:hypothetical protein